MIGISVLPLLLAACEGLPDDVLYQRGDLDDVLAIGEMRAIEIEEYWQTSYAAGEVGGGYGLPGNPSEGTSFDTWYDMVQEIGGADSQGRQGIYYGEVGPGDKGTYGGVTFTFRGTGTKVCVVVDPESIFWNQQRSSDVTSEYIYQDRLDDDGDLDMGAGLSAYYTGNPDVSMGDFRVPFTDATGENQYVEFDECARATNGVATHAGRATAESCDIDTTLTEGVEYTVAIKTFSLPINDSALAFGVGVFEVGVGGCAGSASTGSASVTPHPPASGIATECVLPAEWSGGVPDGDGTSSGSCDEKGGEWDWECLERVYCAGKPNKLNSYCETHLGEDDPPCIDNGHVVVTEEEEE